MANALITDLPAASSVAAGTLFEVTTDPSGTPASQKATATQVADFVATDNRFGATVNKLITVGSGGDYATLNLALAAASQYWPLYKSGGVVIEVRMLTGFEMSEQVLLHDGVDLGFVLLTSVDAEVPIIRSALTTEVFDRFPAFSAWQNCTLPIIDVLFNMDTSGVSTEREAFFLYGCSQVVFTFGSGCKNAGSRGLHVSNASRAQARETVFDGAGTIGYRIANCSQVQMRDSQALNCGEFGIAGDGCSMIAAAGCDFSGSAIGVSALSGAVLDFEDGVAQNTTGVVGGQAEDSGRLLATGADFSGAAGDAVAARSGGIVVADGATLSNAGGSAIEATDGGFVSAFAATGTGAGGIGVLAARLGRVVIDSGDFSGAAGAQGIFALDGGEISARNCNCQKGASTDASDISIGRGGIIRKAGATGGVSTPINALTSNGIIFG